MKLFRQLFFVLIAAFILPQLQGGSVLLQKSVAGNTIHAANTGISALKAPNLRTTVTIFKRRPVGLNDGHEKVSPVFLAVVTARYIYVDKVLAGYHYNPYLSVPIPLRSWRGPPTA
ncbi:hypothetical protein CLV51_108158 [Chitinophaga niastensis]|uniref:Uncharacterized protein n=1 Tax=Chitinophaga niastensis TaxID=536980 RepID=A0A2P8HB60_CHINA|nr:hypothetical protein [Chitinophaga niastensis]PSL43468.1 hypothetical protein CLV51_108158 [Chitinophaga niastensis]